MIIKDQDGGVKLSDTATIKCTAHGFKIERYPIKDRGTWLEWRRRDVTASDIGAICGLHPTRTPLTVYAEKMGALKRGDSNIMRRGRWMEACFVEAFKDERPDLELRKVTEYIRDPELRIGATPDFFGYDNGPGNDDWHKFGLIETKIVAWPEFKRKWIDDESGWDGEDEDAASDYGGGSIVPPIHYQLQALTQAKLAGSPWAMIGAMAIDAYRADLFQCPIDLDEGAWSFVKSRVERFWWHFDKGEPPEVTPALDEEALKALYPKDSGKMADLSGNSQACYWFGVWASLLDDEKTTKSAMKDVKNRIDEAKNGLKAIMGSLDISSALINGREVSWKSQRRAAMDATEFRVMRLKKVGK